MSEIHETPDAATPRAGAGPDMRCDFCGEGVPLVRRVAVDAGYERLQPPHKELYACPPCSARKEKARLGMPGR